MAGSDLSSTAIHGAVRELRSLAAAALARSLAEPAEFPARLPHLSALLMPEEKPPRAVLRRGARVNRTMPFAAFEPVSPLQHRILAAGLRPRLAERAVTRLRKRLSAPPSSWIAGILGTALAAPGFQAQAQMTVYRGLRRRVFFGPGGPPARPLSVATFLALIIWSGRPKALAPPAWARLEAIAAKLVGQPGWAGPTDRLVLAEARKLLGLAEQDAPVPGGAGSDDGQSEKGIGNVPG